jgi:hypothetical protein
LRQARCGSFWALQRGQVDRGGLAAFQAERRWWVRMRELFFFGTAMVLSSAFGLEQLF